MKDIDLIVAKKLETMFGDLAMQRATYSLIHYPFKGEAPYLASHMLAFLTMLVVDGKVIIKENIE